MGSLNGYHAQTPQDSREGRPGQSTLRGERIRHQIRMKGGHFYQTDPAGFLLEVDQQAQGHSPRLGPPGLKGV